LVLDWNVEKNSEEGVWFEFEVWEEVWFGLAVFCEEWVLVEFGADCGDGEGACVECDYGKVFN